MSVRGRAVHTNHNHTLYIDSSFIFHNGCLSWPCLGSYVGTLTPIHYLQIWTCLDMEDYLSASRLFLLAQHINTNLQLTSQGSQNFLYWFPVLNRQWAAISHFKFTILQVCISFVLFEFTVNC